MADGLAAVAIPSNLVGAIKLNRLRLPHLLPKQKHQKQTGAQDGPHHQTRDSRSNLRTAGLCRAAKGLAHGAQPTITTPSQNHNKPHQYQHQLQLPLIPGEHHKHQPPAWMAQAAWVQPGWAIWAQPEWLHLIAASICKRNNRLHQPGVKNPQMIMQAGIKPPTGVTNK